MILYVRYGANINLTYLLFYKTYGRRYISWKHNSMNIHRFDNIYCRINKLSHLLSKISTYVYSRN